MSASPANFFKSLLNYIVGNEMWLALKMEINKEWWKNIYVCAIVTNVHKYCVVFALKMLAVRLWILFYFN